ncbi:LysR family transcriptional regulator [Leucobacter sp. G161]|uniref:LysR family transcriptional regulator n=1 Tax=Leucobacter sp. G161 TaxID=663704 RepID=UPI0009F9F9B6|nr:LysR family transcriptional regulator [Leucobacter sp. G161]
MVPTTKQLRAFVAVADSGSFTDAAAALGVSQSAVSHAIAGLERELAGPLFDRRTLSLTSLGQRTVGHARAASVAIETLEAAARGDRSVSGPVRLGAVPTVCRGLLPELIEEWAAALPDVRVDVFEGDDDEMPEWLENGFVDIAILVDPAEQPAHSKVVDVDEYAAVIREDHPLVELPEIPLAELSDDGMIVSSGGCETHVQSIFAAAGIPLEVRHRVRETSTLLAMVEQGFGVSIVPTLGRGMLPSNLRMRPLVERRARRLVLALPDNRDPHPVGAALLSHTRSRRAASKQADRGADALLEGEAAARIA